MAWAASTRVTNGFRVGGPLSHMVEYRPIPDDQRDAFHEYTSYAFNPTDGPPAYDPDEHDTPRADMGARRGLYDDGAPADAAPRCVCLHHWFDARVRGEVHPTPGLSAVASPPENRRGGYVRRLLAASLEEYRERGARFSVLWPFRYRFYRRLGWDTSNRYATYECDPETLSFAADAVDNASSYRRVEADDYAELVPAYEAHAERYALSLERDADWWRHRIFERWGTDPFVYAVERDGAVRGYLVYTIDGDWGERTMRVRELAYADREAYLALLAFCRTHDSQVSTVRIRDAPDAPLLALATDPDEIDCELETGPMVRIVDVAGTLSALSYPAVDASLTLAVSDPLVERNDGAFGLEAADGAATCEPTSADPDVRIDVAALSQLAVGSRSATALEWAGRLEGSATAVEKLEALFPETDVFLRDGF